MENVANRYLVLTSSDEENKESKDGDRKLIDSNAREMPTAGLRDPRVSCLLFLSFSDVAFSEISIFYVPMLGMDHLHLNLVHVKLIFLNCAIFILFSFLALNHAVKYVDERKLLLIPLFMDIFGILLLMYLAFFWNQVEDIQYYILFIYLCLSMPYLAYPLGNSIVTKCSDSKNAAFIQGFSFAIIHVAYIAGQVGISYVFTKIALIYYCV